MDQPQYISQVVSAQPSGLSSNKNLGKSEEIMIRKFIMDEQGQDLVEYSLLLVLIGATALFVLTAMGTNIASIFGKINNRLSQANDTIDSASGSK